MRLRAISPLAIAVGAARRTRKLIAYLPWQHIALSALVVIVILRRAPVDETPVEIDEEQPRFAFPRQPIAWVDNFPLAVPLLRELDFRIGGSHEDWDVYLGGSYPFNRSWSSQLRHLEQQARINWFPGSSCVSEYQSAVEARHRFLPAHYRLPSDAAALAKARQDASARFDVLDRDGYATPLGAKLPARGVMRRQVRAHLVDGQHRVTVGVYALLTAISPTRAYIYWNDFELRFYDSDQAMYQPHGAEYRRSADIPIFAKLVAASELSSERDALYDYLQNRSTNADTLFSQLIDATRELYARAEQCITKAVSRFFVDEYATSIFFDGIRLEFLLAEDFSVWLLRVDPVATMGSDARRVKQHPLVAAAVRDAFILVGMEPHVIGHYRQQYEMQVFERNVAVFHEDCDLATGICVPAKYRAAYEASNDRSASAKLVPVSAANCSAPPVRCQLCFQCMAERQLQVLKQTVVEFIHRRGYRMLLPPAQPLEPPHPIESSALNDERTAALDLSGETLWLREWFLGKCYSDPKWCTW